MTHTLSGVSNDSRETKKIMSRTGVHIPLPKQQYKSPTKHV